jgi:hypothetical protein
MNAFAGWVDNTLSKRLIMSDALSPPTPLFTTLMFGKNSLHLPLLVKLSPIKATSAFGLKCPKILKQLLNRW